MGDLLVAFLVIIGFWCGLYFIIWIIRTIFKFLETLKYKAKLKKITPQIESINTEELSSILLSTTKSFSSLMGHIQQQYGITDEQLKDIHTYQEKEAVYKRRTGDIIKCLVQRKNDS